MNIQRTKVQNNFAVPLTKSSGTLVERARVNRNEKFGFDFCTRDIHIK